MSLLSVAHLDVSLAGRRVLRDISFDLKAGEFVGLIGPNGAGKSSLLRGVMGLVPVSGDVRFAGKEKSALTAVERALQAAYIAQSREVAWAMPVETLVALGRVPHLARFAPLGMADRGIVDDAIRRMDVEGLRGRPATELSGGELARVLIARALAQDTPLLLADEPSAGLDPAHQIGLMHLFRDLAARGRSVVASTHDIGLAARFCTRLILLKDGELIADGAPMDVLTPARLDAVYGVKAFIGEAEQRPVLLPTDLSHPPETGP